MDVHNRQIQASYPHCGFVCVYAICFMRDGCERMCESIKYVPSFVRTHMWMSVCDFQACVFVC